MKSSKRDMKERAFLKGYNFGFSGRSKEKCPHQALPQRQAWLRGWRLGWTARVSGSYFSVVGRVKGLIKF